MILWLPFHLGCLAATDKAIVLGTEPLAPDEVAVEMTVQIDHHYRSNGPRDIEDAGTVSLGKVHIEEINKHLEARNEIVPVPGRLYLVYFMFTLHPPLAGRLYRQCALQITLTDKESAAYDLLASSCGDQADRYLNVNNRGLFSLGAEGFLPRPLLVKPRDVQVNFFGIGEHEFYWFYKSIKDKGIPEGSHVAVAVLEVPEGKEKLTATLEFRGLMATEITGWWFSSKVLPIKARIDLDLKTGKTSTTLLDKAK